MNDGIHGTEKAVHDLCKEIDNVEKIFVKELIEIYQESEDKKKEVEALKFNEDAENLYQRCKLAALEAAKVPLKFVIVSLITFKDRQMAQNVIKKLVDSDGLMVRYVEGRDRAYDPGQDMLEIRWME